jgi:Protein of unknown function (DUF2796)
MSAWALALLPLLLFPGIAVAQQPHEHGAATLSVALDGGKLLVDLESPLDNLVGFEHVPRTDQQRAAIKKMEERLQAGDRVLRPAAAAGCTVRAVRIEHPYRTGVAGGVAPAESAKPKAEAKGGQSKGKGAKTEETHAELRATYELECAKPEALDRLEVLFFDAFPGMKRIRAQTASPRGQGSKTLTARSRTLSF